MLSTLKKAAFCVVLAVVVFLVIDVGFRLLEPGPVRMVDEFPYIPDETLGQLHKPGFEGSWRGSHFETNAAGLRGPELRDRSTPALFRVLCIGDSLTYGSGVADEDSWPRLLEARLAERLLEREVEVLNLGVRGWSGPQYLEAWRRHGVDLVPDLVILGWSIDDLPGASEILHDIPFPEPAPSQGFTARFGRTAVARHFRAEWNHRDREERWLETRRELKTALESWRLEGGGSLRQEVATLIEKIRVTGAKPVLLAFPYEFQVRSVDADRSPEGSLGMICAGLDVPFLPIGPTFREHLVEKASFQPTLYLRGDLCHPNEKGHELIAEDLFLTLERASLIP